MELSSKFMRCPTITKRRRPSGLLLGLRWPEAVRLLNLFSVHASLLFANMAVGLLYLFAGGDMGQTFGIALVR